MGGGKGGSSSSTVSIPPEVLARYNSVNARAEDVAKTPFTPYSTDPNAFVAPLTSTQQAGIANINNLQGSANGSVNNAQMLQALGINTAGQSQNQALGIDTSALQGISQAQQQGTAYNQAAGRNIGNAMNSAAPYMQQNANLQMQGYGQEQALLGQAVGNASNIVGSADPYLQEDAALQRQAYAQQQAYQQAATQNIGNAMNSAAPYVQQMANLTNQGLQQGQGYLQGATGLTQNAINVGNQYAQQAQPYYAGALQAANPLNQQAVNLTGMGLAAAQPLNQQAQNYMAQGAQNVNAQALDYSQYMNPYTQDVVKAQQALQQEQDAQQRSALQGQAIAAGAFGGDRAGIAQANLARQQSLANQATNAGLLQSGFNQAQAAAQQQQGVGLAAAQANRAAQQQAAQQAAALGQQQYAQALGAGQQFGTLGQQQYGQQLGLGQAIAALGQQQYLQNLGTGAQINQLGQTGYQQNLGAGAQLGQVGQNLFNQNITQGTALSDLGMRALQAGQSTGTNLGGIGMNYANLNNMQASALGSLGQQALQAGQSTGTNMGNIGQQLFNQNISQGQAIQGLGNQQFTQGLQGAQAAAGIGQNIYGMGSNLAGLQQTGGMNIGNLGLQNQAANISAAQAQMGAGQIQQQTNQAGKTALYNQFLQQQGYPFQLAQFLAGIAEGTGALSGSTTNTTRTGYRGGRMNQYASGGLIPDSMGGAIKYDGRRQHFEGGGDSGGNNHPDTTDTTTTTTTTPTTTLTPDLPAGLFAANNTSLPVNPNYNPGNPVNEAADTLKALNPNISKLYQSELGRNPDPSGAAYWQKMYDAGMSLEQIKYNMDMSTEYAGRHPTDNLKGQALTYDPSKFDTTQTPILNQYGSYSGADFTPKGVGRVDNTPLPQAAGKGPSPMQQNYGYQQPMMGSYGYQQPMMGGYGYQQPMMGGYGNTYGGGLGGGYGYQQPMMSNYGMPNFGQSYGGAPNYAAAMQPQYSMPQYGGYQQQYQQPQYNQYQYQQPQQTYGGYQQQYNQYQQPQQQMPTAGGKGPSTPEPTPTPMPAPTSPPTAGGKGPSTSTPTTSTPPTAGGKGPTSSGGAYARGGRTGYAVGGADPTALKNYIDMMSNNPSVMALAAQQKAGYAGMPGNPSAMPGPYGVAIAPSQPRNLMTASAQLGPQQTAMGTVNQAAQFGNSVSSLATGGEKLYDKLQNWGKVKDDIGYRSPNAGNIDPLTKNAYSDVTTEAHGGRIGRNTGGRAHHALDGSVLPYGASNDPNDPSKDPYRTGYMGQLDLSQKINPTQAFNAMKNGQMPTVQETQNPLLSTATTAKNVYDFGKTANAAYDKVAGLLGSNAPTPAGGLASAYPAAPAGTPVPLARPEGLGALTSAPSTATTGAAADAAGKAALASNASPTGLAAAKAAEGSITSSTPALGELMGVGTTAETGAAGAGSLAALGSDAGLLGAGLADAGLIAGGAESALEFLPMFFLNRGGRIGKAGGGGLGAQSKLINPNDPKYHSMKVSFNNLVHKYDNPLLAAAAMNAGTQTVDNAIRQAAHTGKEISDFLPKETVTYMYLLTQAALGAHSKLKQRVARKSGGRTGYALPGFVSASDAQGTTDTLSTPEQTDDQNVQLAYNYANPQTMGGHYSEPEWQAKNLTTVEIPDRGKWTVNKQAAPHFQSFLQELDSMGYPLSSSGGFNPRNIRGTNTPSQHAYGNAIDINAEDNPQGSTRTNLPDNIEEIAKKHNLVWGGNFKNNPDPMHFEYDPRVNDPDAQKNEVASNEATGKPKSFNGLSPQKGPFEKIADTVGVPDVVPREASFWVPLIAGLGGMLASNQYRFSQRLGEGLLAGAGAYGSQQDREFKQQQLAQQAQLQESQIMKNTLGLAAERFKPIGNGQFYDNVRGEAISADEYRNRLNQIPGFSKYAGPMGMTEAGNKSVGETNQPTGQTTGQPEAKPAAQPSANKPADTELPKNMADVQKIYQQVDTIPEVQNAKKSYELLAKQADDPAIVASGQSAAYRTQAAQALSVYKDIRDKYASISMKEAETKAQQPLAIQQEAAKAEIPVQIKAREEAVKEAQVARNLLQQTDAMKNLMFDKDGKPIVNTGPLGQAINRMAAVGKQLGFSDDTIKAITSTNPANAQSIEKLRTTLSTEIGRQEMNGAPIRVSEFNRFLETTPGETLLPESFKWLIDNVLQPKAQATIAAAEKVKRMNPSEHNIQAELDDFARDNPWYGAKSNQSVSQEPVTITGPNDIKNLQRGTPFIIPSGPNKGKVGYAQ